MTALRFPFSAVVGQEDLKLALLLNAIDPKIGGVLLRGQKGTAKSTLARGLAGLLHDGAPFVELPVGATEDRLVGSLDLTAALTGGEQRFAPGLLSAADGGVLYVDEVNLLPDHLVDVLLDVAASGVNRVEREGISHEHSSQFVLVGSMNPEEGELRPQLLDRFGLAVDVIGSADPDERAVAVERRLEFDRNPLAFCERWQGADVALRTRLAAADSAPLAEGLLTTIAALCASVGAEGLRADITIARAAAALAGWEGRPEATVEDVRRVAPLALAHRRRRSPLEDPGIDQQQIDDALGEPQSQSEPDEGAPRPEPSERPEGEGGAGGANEQTAAPAAPTRIIRLETGRGTGEASGRRSMVEGPRGRLVGDRPAPKGGTVRSVAVGATVRAAVARRAEDPSGALVEPGDVREAIREQRAGNLIVLAVDASGSMGAERRMEAAKGAVLSLLLDAYQRRDQVALVTFRGDDAEVLLRPTGSVEVARARLTGMATGGRTPLAAGIARALDVATRATRSVGTSHRPLIVLVSDGRATAAPDGVDPLEAARQAAAAVRRHGVDAVVIDAEDGPTRLGLARELADAMGARYLTVPDLSAGALEEAVRAAATR